MTDVKGMLYDVSEDCYWVYGTKQYKKLSVENEDMDAWQQYIDN